MVHNEATAAGVTKTTHRQWSVLLGIDDDDDGMIDIHLPFLLFVRFVFSDFPFSRLPMLVFFTSLMLPHNGVCQSVYNVQGYVCVCVCVWLLSVERGRWVGVVRRRSIDGSINTSIYVCMHGFVLVMSVVGGFWRWRSDSTRARIDS
jgi:hypothetical protein